MALSSFNTRQCNRTKLCVYVLTVDFLLAGVMKSSVSLVQLLATTPSLAVRLSTPSLTTLLEDLFPRSTWTLLSMTMVVTGMAMT